MKKLLLILACACMSIVALNAQSDAVEQFLQEYPGLKTYYVYQSTLRLANTEGNTDFNKLIRGIRKINVYMAQDSGIVSDSSYKKMVSNLLEEEYETLIAAKYSGSNIDMLAKDGGNKSNYVLTMHNGEDFGLMEMDGKIDLRYLNALSSFNFEKLTEIVSDN